jgi:hypothetical protein
LRGVIRRWIDGLWAAKPEGISAQARGRDGLLSFYHIEKVARLALKLGRTVPRSGFPALLTMMHNAHYQERLTDLLDSHTREWDDQKFREQRSEMAKKVEEWVELEAQQKPWKADPANEGKDTPAKLESQGSEPVGSVVTSRSIV